MRTTIFALAAIFAASAAMAQSASSPASAPAKMVFKHAIGIPIIEAPPVCDVNGDGKIDKTDIKLIMAAIGRPTFPGDPVDGNKDGVINIVDVRVCTLKCTNANCAE